MKTRFNLKHFIALLVVCCLALTAFTACSAADPSAGVQSDLNFHDGPGGDNPPDKPSGEPGGNSTFSGTYTALKTCTEDVTLTGETFDSTGTDEIAVLISSDVTAILKEVTVTRDSDDSTGGDNSSFYGVGAAILATDGTAYISDSTITTDAKGGAGVFAYGDGVVYVSNTVIRTTEDTSGGVHVAGGGTLYGWNNDVLTKGESSAAIRSDRGGGTMVLDGGTYVSQGTGSPAVYCTATIAVNGATLTAENSEAVCIEGLNSLYLYDCDLSGSMHDDSRNDTTWGIIVYQSTSGDAEVGNSTFLMIGGTLDVKNGGVLYTTNTESHIYLSDVDITASSDSEFFLRATGNSNSRGWGTSGSNGATCNFTAYDQAMEGDVIWDSISTLDFYMDGTSTLKGAFKDDESCAGSGGNGYANLYISESSVWTVTGDSTLTNLYCAGQIVDEDGKTVSIVDANGEYLSEGASDYTITVTGSYSTTVSFLNASSAVSYDLYKKDMPDVLA